MRPLIGLLLCTVAPFAAGCGRTPSAPGGTDSPDAGYGVLAQAGAATVSGPVDGIRCDSSEAFVLHIHAHLAIYSGGTPLLVPAGVGIGPPLLFSHGFVTAGACFSWLHTHDTTGVIHIESPVARVFTLGNFFDVWGQPLAADRVGPLAGAVTAYLDGRPFSGDPAGIPLGAHALVQLDVGAPLVPPQPYTFAPDL